MRAAHALFLSWLVRWRSYRDDVLAQALEEATDRAARLEVVNEHLRRQILARRLVDLTLDGEGEVR